MVVVEKRLSGQRVVDRRPQNAPIQNVKMSLGCDGFGLEYPSGRTRGLDGLDCIPFEDDVDNKDASGSPEVQELE